MICTKVGSSDVFSFTKSKRAERRSINVKNFEYVKKFSKKVTTDYFHSALFGLLLFNFRSVRFW